MAIDNDTLLAAIDEARTHSYGADEHSELSRVRARAIEAYLGLNTNPAPEGRSQVVDRAVYETISTMLPSLVRIFASSSEDVCKFVPVGPEDEGAAEQATAAINHVVTRMNQWEQICSDWIHDGLVLGNGYAMAYWDESTRRVRETYQGQSDDQLAALLADKDVEVIQHSQTVDQQATAEQQQAYEQALQQFQMAMAQYQQAAMQAQQAGQQPPPPPQQPQPPQPVLLHDLVIERSEQQGKVAIKVLPPEHVYVSGDTPDWTLNECPYFEVRIQKTIADLQAMGLEVPEDVSDDDEADPPEDNARDRFSENDDGTSETGVMRRVWSRMIWVKADAEGDGVSRLYYVIAVGRTILYSEPCARIPVASLTPQPLPHRHMGMGVAETVLDIQDIRTAVTRGALDNLYLANNGRHVVSSRVNLEDFLDARPGGIVRMLDDSMPAEGHIVPLAHPFAFDSIIGSLNYFDELRQNRTGATRYFSGTDAGAINKTAAGTAMLQNAASMRVEHIARMIAPAVESLFSVVHEVLSKHANKALTIKINAGRWVTIDPQAWRTKRDVKISVGVGAGNKESMFAQLQQIYASQLQLAQLGLPVAGPQQIHATVSEMAKLAGFSSPEKFWQDPSRLPPAPPAPPPPQIQVEQMRIQADQAKLQFEAQQEQLRFQAEQALKQDELRMRMEVDKAREEMQARQKALEAEQQAQVDALKAQYEAQREQEKLAFERWQAELQATVQLQIAQLKQPQINLPVDDRVEQMLQMAQQVIEQINAPAEVIRDENGKIAGVRRGAVVRVLQRGPDGRVMGVQ